MLDMEEFLNIFSNSLFSQAGIAGLFQGRVQQIIVPEQREFVKRLFLLQSSRLKGIFLLSVLSSLCAWSRRVLHTFCPEPENNYAKRI